MSADRTVTAEAPAPASTPAGPAKPRSQARKITRVLAWTLVAVLVVAALLVAFPPIGLFKDTIAQRIGASLGRTVTIGAAHLQFRPDALLVLENVTLSNPPAMPGPDLFRAESIAAKIRVWPLFKGEVDVATLDVSKPELNLQEDGTGANNWTFAADPSGAPAPLVLPRMTSARGGRVVFTSAKTGQDATVGNVDVLMAVTQDTGVTEIKGQFGLKNGRVSFGAALADYRALAGGKPTTARAALEASHLRAEVAGEAVMSVKSAFAGDLKVSTDSLVGLAGLLGADVTEPTEPLSASLEGRVKATPSDVLFAATSLIVAGNTSRVDGRLSLGGPRPKFEGIVAADRLDLSRFIGGRTGVAAQALAPRSPAGELTVDPAWDDLLLELKALESGGAARIAPEAALSAAPAAAWSDRPINLGAMRALDLDVILTVAELDYAGLDMQNGRLKAGLVDGRLVSTLEALEMGPGQATGTIKVDSRAEPPRADVALALKGVAAEPIVNAFSGSPLLSGTSSVDITASASGQNQSQLASSLEGKAKFSMGPGALRGFDIRLMISQWWRKWTFDIARKTSFERLDAQYDIKSGVLRSAPDLALGGPEVEINSKGNINLPSKRLDQEIRIKVVPPPAAFPIPVRISGAWSQPEIGIDWAGLFSSTGGLGGPQSIAPSAEPPPLAVEIAIRRILASGIPGNVLTEDGRAMLRSLLPEQRSPSPSSDTRATPQ